MSINHYSQIRADVSWRLMEYMTTTYMHFCGNVIRRLTLGRRHFARREGDVIAPGGDEAEHVDALFAMLNYLDVICISDYFPTLIGLYLDGHERIIKGADAETPARPCHQGEGQGVAAAAEGWRAARPVDLLDVLGSLDDNVGRPLLTVEEIKAQTIVSHSFLDNGKNTLLWPQKRLRLLILKFASHPSAITLTK